MTREDGEDERRESSERAGSEATREQSEDDQQESSESRAAKPRDSEADQREPSEKSSGEQSDPRDDDDDIPLNIAGHEDRDRPSESSMLGDDDAEETGSVEGTDTEAEIESDEADGEDENDEEVQPVEVLVQLAKDGEIEPWDIDIVTVTDKFLDRLDESDLQTSGRALFYASVLLRMKGDAMVSDEEDEPEPEPWEAAAMGEERPVDPEADPFAALEGEIDRRLERKRARGMPQTLDELVRDLREAERDSWWKESREYDTSDSPRGFQRGTQELDYRHGDDIRMDEGGSSANMTGAAHEEDMDRIIEDVYANVREQWDAGRDEVLYAEVEHAGGSRVETFLGLLFLSHQGRVQLQQDELFGDLWIQDPNAATGSEEAVAD